MKEFQHIDKRMPYVEKAEYVEQLVHQATENAIARKPRPRFRVAKLTTSLMAAASLALLIGVGVNRYMQPMADVVAQAQGESPFDEFLGEISDEEAQLLACYDLEELPEYE